MFNLQEMVFPKTILIILDNQHSNHGKHCQNLNMSCMKC